MNFTTYDNVNSKRLDRTKTWINPRYKQVFSAEIKYKNYYQIIVRYNTNTKENEYFVAFMDNKDEDNKSCRIDELGRTRFSIANIWNDFCNNITKETNIKLNYEESFDNVDIFRLSL
uniref:Uncharacterized protein n=1 Tax=Geladintestivirus 1 TaxID=3233133 RepID=A0AAU8MJZ9_9CAUD